MAKKPQEFQNCSFTVHITPARFLSKKMFDSWIVGVNVWKLLDRDWLFSKIVIKMDSLKK